MAYKKEEASVAFRMIDDWIWDKPPPGFKKVRGGRRHMLLIRSDLPGSIGIDVFTREGTAEPAIGAFQGRDQLRVVELGHGDAALIRRYSHGGLFRRVTGKLFFTWPPRPFKELAVMEEARRRGVPTVEVIGACVDRICGPIYRGWLATRQLKNSVDLWTALERGVFQDVETEQLLRAVANSVHVLHHSGVYHDDLNLKNILVRYECGAVRSYLIDFDKARVYSKPLSERMAMKNIGRLYRSTRKLDPAGEYFSDSQWTLFVRFYQEMQSGDA